MTHESDWQYFIKKFLQSPKNLSHKMILFSAIWFVKSKLTTVFDKKQHSLGLYCRIRQKSALIYRFLAKISYICKIALNMNIYAKTGYSEHCGKIIRKNLKFCDDKRKISMYNIEKSDLRRADFFEKDILGRRFYEPIFLHPLVCGEEMKQDICSLLLKQQPSAKMHAWLCVSPFAKITSVRTSLLPL